MLPKPQRLVKDADIRRVFARGRSFFSSPIAFRVLRTSGTTTRFAFVVSAKISKKAVVRNQIRRRLRGMVARRLDRIRPGYDVVVLAVSPSAATMPADKVEALVDRTLGKAGLLT